MSITAVQAATTTHDRPEEYGCAPEHYAPPRTPEGWTLVATHNPPEPYGWRGACRVVLHMLPGGETDGAALRHARCGRDRYAVHIVTPSGAMTCGDYRADPLDAFRRFMEDAAAEDKRAARYIAAAEAAVRIERERGEAQ